MRVCRNKTGPGEESFINSATRISSGNNMIKPVIAADKSKIRFMGYKKSNEFQLNALICKKIIKELIGSFVIMKDWPRTCPPWWIHELIYNMYNNVKYKLINTDLKQKYTEKNYL